MGMIKKGTTVIEEPKKESGVDAAIERLNKANDSVAQTIGEKVAIHYESKYPKPRDFDAEARGKTRCVQWEAAVMSPSLAGMKWKTTEDFLKHVKQIADAGVAYTFSEKIEGL